VPVWIGELKAGYERNQGQYVNPEYRTPNEGLAYAGVSVPLPISQGFFIDARRNTLRQAQLFRDIAEADRVKEINKLLLSAAKDYWNWYYAYNEYRHDR
jgi:outer membrane protein TolC